jgi:hypothetical protein
MAEHNYRFLSRPTLCMSGRSRVPIRCCKCGLMLTVVYEADEREKLGHSYANPTTPTYLPNAFVNLWGDQQCSYDDKGRKIK